jgi:hypothetical protein
VITVPFSHSGRGPQVPTTQVVRQVIESPVPTVLDPNRQITTETVVERTELTAQMT